MLCRDNSLNRRDFQTGTLIDSAPLGAVQMKSMYWNVTADQAVLSSSIHRCEQRMSIIFFRVVKLHPFMHLASFAVSSAVFPGEIFSFRNSG